MKRNREKQSGARRKTHRLELKLQVLQQLNAGASVSDVCRAFGVAVTTVALWRRAYAQGGYEALFPKTPGPAKASEGAPDPRREAVIALKKANPEYGTRRIRDLLKRFEALPISVGGLGTPYATHRAKRFGSRVPIGLRSELRVACRISSGPRYAF
jgi:transposase-like protein